MAGARHVDYGESAVATYPGNGLLRHRVALHTVNQQDGALHSGPIVPQVEAATSLGAIGEQSAQVMPVDAPRLLVRPAGAVVGAVEQDRVRRRPGMLLRRTGAAARNGTARSTPC